MFRKNVPYVCVIFISPVKIEIFQVCLFHIIGNFIFHPKNFFPEYLLNYECISWMNRGKLCLYQGIIEMTLLIFFLFPVFQTRKPNPTIKQKMNSNKHKLSFNLNQLLVNQPLVGGLMNRANTWEERKSCWRILKVDLGLRIVYVY